MTQIEITQITKIMMKADGGCGYCVSELLNALDKQFPGFTKTIQKVWEPEYGSDFKK